MRRLLRIGGSSPSIDCCGAGTSVSALKRERADVRQQTRVRYLILAEGINDIGYHADAGGRRLSAGTQAAGRTITR